MFELAEDYCSNKCLIDELRNQNDENWDNLSDILSHELSEIMTEKEKNLFIQTRNARLMRMFESFDELDSAIINAINDTEKKDQEIARRIKSLRTSLIEIQDDIEKELMLVENNSKLTYLNQRISSIKSANCH